MDQVIAKIALDAESGREAIQHIYSYKKTLNSKYSLNYIGQRIGLKSRGTLSEMIQGKRKFSMKYVLPVLVALDVSPHVSQFIETIFELENATQEKIRKELEIKIQSFKVYFNDRFTSLNAEHGFSLLASDILCAFGLFNNKPTERDLIDFFGKSRVMSIVEAIHSLVKNGLIEKENDYYIATENFSKFVTAENQESYSKSYLKDSINDAMSQLGYWNNKVDVSCFGSTVMTVKLEDYKKVLDQIRNDMFKYFSALETKEGDTVVRLNMQVYPIKPLKSK